MLGNALKFTPEGGRVAVSLSAEPESVRIAVSDTGQGIEPDFLPRVFDSYRQGESQAPRKQHGLGLGLPIARYIIEAHGGTIAAASPGLGQGAVFTVTLPRAASHEKAESRL